MRILFVSEFIRHISQPGQTGGTISNYHFLNALAERAEVTIISFDRNIDAVDLYRNEGIPVIAKPAPPWRNFDLIRNWNKFVIEEVSQALARHAADLLIATTSTVVCLNGVSCRSPNQPKRVAIIQSFENFGFRALGLPWELRIELAKQAIARRGGDREAVAKADHIITNSRFMRSRISSTFGRDAKGIHVVPQLCDVFPLPDQTRSGSAEVGFVNRGQEKNALFVLRLAKELPHYRFAVFGSPIAGAKRLPRNVEFRGYCTDRHHMFSTAQLWIVPSIWPEPFGRVSIEAQAANRRVLVANTGGLPETVFNDLYLVSGYDPKEWANRIRQLLCLSDKIVSENGAYIRRRFSRPAYKDAVFAFLDYAAE